MRRIILASTLLLAGCATRPQLPETPAVQSPTTREPRGILGMTTSELVGHFGNPALQIREGTSLKLQFRARSCVLDAYLYPQNNVLRVTHVDTRTLSGVDSDQAACVSALEYPS
jgi:hypothetical protein